MGKKVEYDIQTSPVRVVCSCKGELISWGFFGWWLAFWIKKSSFIVESNENAKTLGLPRTPLKLRGTRVVGVLQKSLALSVKVELRWAQMFVLTYDGLYCDCTCSKGKFQCRQSRALADNDWEWPGGEQWPRNILNLSVWDADM